MSGTVGRRIEDEALTVLSMLISVVRRLDQQRKEIRFKLVCNVDQCFSEWASSVLRSFSYKPHTPALAVYIMLSEVPEVGMSRTDLRADLSKDAQLAFMVDETLVSLDHSLASADGDIGVATFGDLPQFSVYDAVH